MSKEFPVYIKSLIIFLSVILILFFVCWVIKGTKFYSKTVEVKGYAETIIVSDFGPWRAHVSVESKNMAQAYTKLEHDKERVVAYLLSLGIPETKIKFDPITVSPQFERTPQGVQTNKIVSYEASVALQVLLHDIQLIQKYPFYTPCNESHLMRLVSQVVVLRC